MWKDRVASVDSLWIRKSAFGSAGFIAETVVIWLLQIAVGSDLTMSLID